MARDQEVNAALEQEGWTVIRFWERQIRKELDRCVDEILTAIKEKQEDDKEEF